MHCVEVLLCATPGALPNALDAALRDERRRITLAASGQTAVRIAHSAAHHRVDALRHNASIATLDELLARGLPPAHAPVALTGFDAVLELRAPDEVDPHAIIDGLGGLVGRLGPAVDPARSAVVMGVDYLLLGGGGPVQLFYCLRRAPKMNAAVFKDYWLHELTKHTSKTPSKTGYRQVHADPALSAAAAAATGLAIDDFDGVALEWYPDFDGLLAASKWAGGTPDVVEAETRMIDFGAARAMLSYSHDPDTGAGSAAFAGPASTP